MQIKLETFEGPFDLLLELARAKKVDLSRISLQAITNDFLHYMEAKTPPPALLGDFLVVGSTLALIKIRQLLPQLAPDEEEEVENLTERIQVYQQYRMRAGEIRQLWWRYPLLPALFWAEGIWDASPNKVQITSQEVATAFLRCVGRIPAVPQPQAHLRAPGRNLKEVIDLFRNRLTRFKRLTLQEFLPKASPAEAAVSFLAVLEMAQRKEVRLVQSTAFGQVTIHRENTDAKA